MTATIERVAIDHEELRAEVEDNARDYCISYPITGELPTGTFEEATLVQKLRATGIQVDSFDTYALITVNTDEQAIAYADVAEEFDAAKV